MKCELARNREYHRSGTVGNCQGFFQAQDSVKFLVLDVTYSHKNNACYHSVQNILYNNLKVKV
jgi:hypothetical protein